MAAITVGLPACHGGGAADGLSRGGGPLLDAEVVQDTERVEVGLPHVLRGARKAQVGMESWGGECLVADVRPRR